MIFCPICLKKINKELHDVSEGVKCPHCKQEFDNTNAVSAVPFPDCVTKVKYVGLNSVENANLLFKMMQ
jgi:hypothetical protein